MIKQEIVAKLLKNGRFYAKRKCLRVSVLFYILSSKERVKELPLTALKNTLNINKLNDYFRLLTAEKKKRSEASGFLLIRLITVMELMF